MYEIVLDKEYFVCLFFFHLMVTWRFGSNISTKEETFMKALGTLDKCKLLSLHVGISNEPPVMFIGSVILKVR